MTVKTQATVEDLARVPENGKAELVNGELVLMSPTGGYPSYVSGEIYSSLRDYAKKTRSGHAIPDNAGFIVDLPNRGSFSPDAAFHTGPLSMSFIEGAPIFAVEVRSKGDYGPTAEREMADKRADYFAAGTKSVWDVDILGDIVVRLYTSDSPTVPKEFKRGEIADAGAALPGWTMNVDDMFN